MSSQKKSFTIFGLAAMAVILAGAVFFLAQPTAQFDPADLPDETIATVAVGVIAGGNTIEEPEIKPNPAPLSEQPVTAPGGNDIKLTVIEDKPGPPEKPETAHNDDDENHEPPANPALTDPDKIPEANPKPAETAPPKDNSPKPGDKNGNGEVFIPGFGWVKDEGGGGHSEVSVGKGSLDKIIGR